MITEHAELRIDPANAGVNAKVFESAVAQAAPLFRATPGCYGMSLSRVIEELGCYRLLVQWRSVEDHMVTFRESAAFQEWRALVGGFFAALPIVTHSDRVARYF